MILKEIVVLSFFCFSLSSCAQHNTKNDIKSDNTDGLKVRSERLMSLYDKALNGNYEDSVHFFTDFPATFKEFHSLYGFNGGDYHLLYNESHKHVNLFCDLNNLSLKNEYYNKLITISLGGEWQVDAVNHLQYCIISKIKDNNQYLLQELKKRSDKEILMFWQFVLDGPYLSPAEFREIVSVLDSKENRMMSIAKSAYDETQSSEGNNIGK